MRSKWWWAVSILLGIACGGSNSSTGGITGATGGQPASGTGGLPGGAGTTPNGTTAGHSASTGGAPGTPGTGGTVSSVAGTSAAGHGATGGMVGGSAGAAAGAGTMTAGAGGSVAGSGSTPGMGSCGPETDLSPADLGDPMKRGPWTPTMKMGGPSGQSTLFYPMDLGKGGVLHPVFHWGCGAGSTPSQYADHLNLLASHGFVVIANASGSMPAKPSLDWILGENEKMGSDFFHKLDPNRVGIGGHSLGALETFQAAADPRIKLYVLVCGGSGSGTTGAADIHAPSIFLGGEGEGGTMNFVADYDAIKTQPSIFITKTNTDHIYCARNNLGPWVAFMRMNYCGETKWKQEFMPGGTYCKSPWLDCKTKNFM